MIARWDVNPNLTLTARGTVSVRTMVAVALAAVLLTLGVLGWAQHRQLTTLQRERDSLWVAVQNFDVSHAAGVRIDTLRADTVRVLTTRADTLVREIHHLTTDTIILARVDTLRADYTAALAADSARIAFWKNGYDSVVTQRDRAQALLKQIPTPPSWTLAATVDQALRINVCGMKPLARVLGMGVNVGVCYRT